MLQESVVRCGGPADCCSDSLFYEWPLISPLMYGTYGSILVYFHFLDFLDKSAILLKQCLIYYRNSQIWFLLPLLSWLCGIVLNFNLVLFSLYGESNLDLIIFSHKSFLICVLPLSFSDDKCYQNFISSFTFAISFYRISMFRLYTCVEEGER